MRVLIIGGGFGGLCLANGLQRQAGIEIEVFERHEHPAHDLAGYGLHIGLDGKRALQHCLDNDSWERFLATTTPAGSQWAFRNPQLQMIALRDDAKLTGIAEETIERRAVHRFGFRDILLKSLAAGKPDGGTTGTTTKVHWGKSFTHYESLDSGRRVRAHFADGTSAEGDILVGADGSKSKVREQRLPHLQREALGIVIICGRYQLDEARRQALPSIMTDSSMNNIIPAGKGWLFMASFPHAEDEVGPTENYTLWAYVIPKSQTPADAKSLSPEQMRDIALAGVQGWHPSLSTIIRDADLATVSPIVLQSMPHLPAWDTSNVTLLGDAIHNMTPMAGVGANIALRDAHILGDLVIEAYANHGGTSASITDAIAKYESKMRAYANDAVGLSRQIAAGASSDSSFERTAFLAVLRLAGVSDFVMRRTIGKGGGGFGE